MKSLLRRGLLAAVIAAATGGGPVSAQQVTGVPGSPEATTTLVGQQLPPPDPSFGGVIKDNALQSKAWWAPRVVPPKGAPNVVVIMTDDVGFGAPSTFGGVIPTPALDRIAQTGLRYTQFHSTALCSPTRAALITGRNHHSSGFGIITEAATGFPGYNSVLPKDVTTIGQILKENGYGTSWFGKNHNTPAFLASQAGPFDQWPTGMGFEYFYGFLGGDTSQWEPALFRNTSPIQPYVGHPGWNLTTAMADEAIGWMNQLNQIDPAKPFFVYYTPGGTHAPHHPTPEWTKKISDMHLFDKGWNALREQIFANQKRLGVIPPDAELTPWPEGQAQYSGAKLANWDTLSADEKKLFIRQADVYAAFLAYTDHEIGRVIQAIQDMGKLDNTLIIYISGDNGASAEGTMNGTPNEIASLNGANFPVAAQLKNFYDAWGSEQTYPHMATPWAWAFDTPYKWTKQMASHFGGTRQGLAISWPGHITDPGGIRPQFHHVVDVVPTILEAAGIHAPESVNGIKQKPIEGVSMAYTFDKANAGKPSNHRTQYFELVANRAIYHDGWVAATTPLTPPWVLTAPAVADPATAFKWELYDLQHDWTQNHDLAASNPAKLKELQDLFMAEARKYQVLPLDAAKVTRFVAPRPDVTAGRSEFTYTVPMTGVPLGDAPNLLNTSYKITADIEVPAGGAEGVLLTQGGRFGGWGFYLLQGKPVFTWNILGLARPHWQSPQALAPGRHTLVFDFKYDGLGAATLAYNNISGIGRGGTGVLSVDGQTVATQKMERTIPLLLQWDETFDIGSDTGTSVDDRDYHAPFAFTGRIVKLDIKIDRPQLSEADVRLLQAEGQRDNRKSE